MGFLRKIGRKIKKGAKKLFGGKFGKILGGIGLAMTFWGGANALFGGKGGWFDSFSNKLKDMKPFGDNTITKTIEKLDESKLFGGEDPLNIGEKIAKVGVETGKQFVKAGESIGETIASPFKGEFDLGKTVADVTESTIKQSALNILEGEPEEPFYSKGVQQVGSMEAPQSAYVAEVNSQIPTLQATNFNQLNQSLFYGTLSPQYLTGQMG